MKRLLSFIVKLLLLVALAVWLADRPGSAHIIWHGYDIETSAAFLGVCVFATGFVLYLLFRLGHLIVHGPEIWRLRRRLKKFQAGQEQLTQALIAVAAGQAAEAGRHAIGARKLLGTTTITRLLQAQAAQLAGDYSAAHEIFFALANEHDSLVLGYRGLIMEALRARNWDEVDKLAGRLHRLRPATPWLSLIRFELSARRGQWDEAGLALSHIALARLIDPKRLRQQRAAVLIALSQKQSQQGYHDKALEAAEQASRQTPDWLPAVITLAQEQMFAGHKRAATRVIERAWAQKPHPQLAAAYHANPDMDLLDNYKQIERLTRVNPDHPVSRYVLAEAALEADLWGEARRHLLALTSQGQATQGAYRLLSKLERRESGNEQAAAQWLIQAIDAPLDPVWLCQTCGGVHQKWQPLCAHCGAFDALEWQSPGQSRDQAAELAMSGLASGGLLSS